LASLFYASCDLILEVADSAREVDPDFEKNEGRPITASKLKTNLFIYLIIYIFK